MAKNKKRKKSKQNIERIINYLMVAFAFLLIAVCTISYNYLTKHPILLFDGSEHVEYGQKYDPKDTISFVLFGHPEDVVIDTNVDDKALGKYKTTYKYKDFIINLDVEVSDTLPPELDVHNYTTDMVEEVSAKRFITKVSDASKVKTTIESMNEKSSSKYDVVIKATDASGNETQKKVTLKRIEDKEGPTVKFNDLEMYETDYLDLLKDVTIKDNCDLEPDVKTNIDEVDIVPGNVEIKYTITDRTGNSTEATRTISVLASPEMGEKNIYLTFDDGPCPLTERILDVLKKYDIKATFFVTGNGSDSNDLIKRAYDEGHTIGLHTYSHSYDIYKSEKTYFEDLEKISDMVYELTGERSKIIRFPGGSSNTVSRDYCEGIMSVLTEKVQQAGYHYVDWNVDSGDANAYTEEVEVLVEKSTDYEGEHGVILMHDASIKETTPEALPEIIEYYLRKGYTFRPLTEFSPIIHGAVRN